MPKGNPNPSQKIKYKGGKEITNPVLYDHWANLFRIDKRIHMLKKDLERDCKAYWKYDELSKDIEEMQKAILMQDKLEQL